MLDSAKAATPQPQPQAGKVDVAPVVLADIQARVEAGKQKYGTLLQTNNGRLALWDLYQELIDACMYIRQRILEEEQWHESNGLIISLDNGENVARTDAVAAYNCWLDRHGKFYASQSYVYADLLMSIDAAVGALRNGRLAVINATDIDRLKEKLGIE